MNPVLRQPMVVVVVLPPFHLLPRRVETHSSTFEDPANMAQTRRFLVVPKRTKRFWQTASRLPRTILSRAIAQEAILARMVASLLSSRRGRGVRRDHAKRVYLLHLLNLSCLTLARLRPNRGSDSMEMRREMPRMRVA